MIRNLVIIAIVITTFTLLGCSGADNHAKKEIPTTSTERLLANVAPIDRLNKYLSLPEITIDESKRYVATIHTHKGEIVLDLDAVSAPLHVNSFVFLARQGFFDGLTFHRVVPNFIIQGGDPSGSGTGGPGYRIPAEIVLPHRQGVIAMARQPDEVNPQKLSSGSQFYITLEAQPHLDSGGYSVFGRVMQGFEVVQQIQKGDAMERVDIEEK